MTIYCSWALPGCILQWFHLLREEEEKMTRKDAPVHLHLLQGRIVVYRDDQVQAILEILLDNLDCCCLPIKHQIENVSTSLFGVQAYTISCSHFFTGNSYRFWRWVILAWKIPTP